MRLPQITFLCLAFCALLPRAQAQGLYEFDDKIDRFIAGKQRDSALYYTEIKASRCRSANQLALWAWVYLDAHDLLSDMGDEPAAVAYLQKITAEKWREPASFDEYEPFCYAAVNQAKACLDAGRMLQAIERYEWAERIYAQYQYPDFEAVETIYKPLGNCYTRLGADDKALAIFMKAIQIGGDHETMAGLYCNIGIALWNKHDFQQSEDFYRKGLALNGISPLKQAMLQGDLAQTLLDEHRKDAAYAMAKASLHTLAGIRESGQLREYRCYSLRTAAMACANTAEAGKLLAAALEDAKIAFGNHGRELGKIEISTAEWMFQNNRFQDVLSTTNKALQAILPRFNPVKASENPDITQFYEENVISQALRLKALAAARLYAVNGDLAGLELAANCHELAWQAESLLRKTYQYDDSKLQQQSSTWENEQAAMQVIRRLYERTHDQQYVEKAIEIAERNKAAVLRDAIGENLIAQRLSGADERFHQLSALRQNYAYFERQLLLESGSPQSVQWRIEADGLQTQISQLEQQLKAAYPRLSAEETTGGRQLPGMLKPDEAIIEYFAGADSIDIFLFLPGRTAIWTTIRAPQKELSAYAAFFNDQNAILSNPAGFLELAWRLWQQLIPVEGRLVQRVLIIPDGVLSNIPFDALVTEAPSSGVNLRNAKYLIRHQELRYAWSLAALAAQQKLVSGAGKQSLVLAPRFLHGEQGMAPLDFKKEESLAGSDIRENGDASWQNFSLLAGQYRILHLATHAFTGDSSAHHAHLMLCDREVFLPDIYGLTLQADLVTLSACETGLGHRMEGEGVMSFARAFAQAGAACVVSSQWSVNDRSTGRLLASFYREIEKGSSIGTALRAAKLEYLNDANISTLAETPYFWAGLTMIGDDRSIHASPGFNRLWAFAIIPLVFLFMRYFRMRRSV